ncbi:hypothetical protein GPECTOR_35g878 [Gonium pectorale]|uniref:[histone H3]-lysine(4) N-trimethyltransferase n=1 Tax=Gonium pectorale TaxID=33097 RepID=A0A150GDM4_GONPE|nr:hypothetical protein GPECTOR_35g878 [Gonium pectorale]|eukprot:KXZ47440.1 hypothetical protein GPECTOR_35g878 [Gonium pectorale]
MKVVCMGRYAELLIRTQRVVYNDCVMPVNSFERICGRGDAKKWKSSLWLVDEQGTPLRPVGDLLGRLNINHTVLAGWAANAQQHEVYERWREMYGGGAAAEAAAEAGAEVKQEEGGAAVKGEAAEAATPALEAEGATAAQPSVKREAAETGVQSGPGPVAMGVDLEGPPVEHAATAGAAGRQPRASGRRGERRRRHAAERDPGGPMQRRRRRRYDADVQSYDPYTGRHHLLYHLDEATEWINLAAEELEGRVQWLPYSVEPEDFWEMPPTRCFSPAEYAAHRAAEEAAAAEAAAAAAAAEAAAAAAAAAKEREAREREAARNAAAAARAAASASAWGPGLPLPGVVESEPAAAALQTGLPLSLPQAGDASVPAVLGGGLPPANQPLDWLAEAEALLAAAAAPAPATAGAAAVGAGGEERSAPSAAASDAAMTDDAAAAGGAGMAEQAEAAPPAARTGVEAADAAGPPTDGGAGDAPSAPHPHLDRRPKAVRWEERLQAALRSERRRITFGKSGIHGWGIFARVDIPQDAVVTEFRGEAVRPVLADLRERRYRAQGRDCYMFHVNGNVVLDSTHAGHYGRFANHSCAPSLYTKMLEFEGGRVRLAFCARTDIRAGQELTFDYRFREEEGSAKVACHCGAPNCKGTLN